MGNRGNGKRGPSVGSIDWEEFHKLASYQCTQKEIADFFNIDVSTLENYYLDRYGEKLSDFWDKKKGHGRAKLKKIQWDLAEQGSAAMAIFLGKHLLGQSDKPVDEQLVDAFNRSGLTREQAIELLTAPPRQLFGKPVKTFEEFCQSASYPVPYPKQVEMMRFGMEGADARLLLGSRGYGKTDYVVILGIAYRIYLEPTFRALIITKSKERNAAMLSEIAKACRANGVTFEKENATSLRITGLQGKDHSVSAVTIKTVTLRGRHPDLVVMDDPVTEDDVSEATRAHVERVYNEVNKLCQNILIIGQPAHQYDLYAKLRPLLRKLEVPHGTIPELDHDLEAQRLAGVDEKSISASYHLKVLTEGSTPFDNVRYIDRFPPGTNSIAFIDPSHEGGDYTAVTILTSYMEGVAVVGFAWKKAWNHALDDIAPKLVQFGVKKLAFETNALGDQPLDILRKVFPGVGVIGRRSNTNKHSRIMAAGAFAHMIHLSKESDRPFTDQVVKYEYKAKHDDAPDSLASCLEWVGLIRGKR